MMNAIKIMVIILIIALAPFDLTVYAFQSSLTYSIAAKRRHNVETQRLPPISSFMKKYCFSDQMINSEKRQCSIQRYTARKRIVVREENISTRLLSSSSLLNSSKISPSMPFIARAMIQSNDVPTTEDVSNNQNDKSLPNNIIKLQEQTTNRENEYVNSNIECTLGDMSKEERIKYLSNISLQQLFQVTNERGIRFLPTASRADLINLLLQYEEKNPSTKYHAHKSNNPRIMPITISENRRHGMSEREIPRKVKKRRRDKIYAKSIVNDMSPDNMNKFHHERRNIKLQSHNERRQRRRYRDSKDTSSIMSNVAEKAKKIVDDIATTLTIIEEENDELDDKKIEYDFEQRYNRRSKR